VTSRPTFTSLLTSDFNGWAEKISALKDDPAPYRQAVKDLKQIISDHFDRQYNIDDLLKKIKRMGERLEKDKLTRDAGRALKKVDLKQVERELRKLAERQKKLTLPQRSSLYIYFSPRERYLYPPLKLPICERL